LPLRENRGVCTEVGAARLLIAGLAMCAAVGVAIFMGGCGYHVAGHSADLPSEWRAIQIPAFKNDTTRYRIEQKFTQAVIQEFLARTKYKVVQNADAADGVFTGEVLSIDTSPALFNATTGEVTAQLVTVHMKVSLADKTSGKVVYHDDDMVFRQEYQIQTDVSVFFDEQNPALQRMAHDLASKIVANVLEGF
jgi:outer membrane lipopolysaccharide assembly protein LptE/RlpB